MKKTKSSQFWYNFYEWINYWRLNIHRFVIEYLGIDIKPFQQLILYIMDSPSCTTITSFVFFASRGLGKTFITMVYCVAKCILYPGIKIKVASSTMRQAVLFLDKIYEIQNGRPNIEREISIINISKDSGFIEFTNGSTIEAVVCSDSARGMRANILILDESRLMSEDTINKALIPFLTLNNRGQLWATNPKYEKYIKNEHNAKIYLTSIGYKDEWSYKDFVRYCNFIADGRRDYFAISMPYQFGVEAGIIQKSYIESVIREGASDIKTVQMEFEVIPHGESESAMFSFNEVNSARQIRVPLIPPTNDEYIEFKGNLRALPYYQKKDFSEIRVISMDIAIAAGRRNDLTAFSVFRCVENGDYYDKELAYMEVMGGANLDDQIIRFKQLFYDLECDYAVIDANGAIGIEAVNCCGSITKDNIRGKRYPGWKTINRVDKFDMRISDPNAEAVLFPIQVSGAGASSLQYTMLVIAQLEFQRNRLSLLVEEDIATDELNKRYKYMVMKTSTDRNSKEKADNMIGPFLNTTEFVKEAVNTRILKLPSGRWTYDEKNGRKDRLMSVIYGLYFINKLEEDLIELNKSVDISKYFSNNNAKSNINSVKNPFYNNLNKLRGFGGRR